MKNEKSRRKPKVLILVTLIVAVTLAVVGCGVVIYSLALGVLQNPSGQWVARWDNSVLYRTILDPSLDWTRDGKCIVATTTTNDWGGGSTYLVRTDGSELKRISQGEDDRFIVEKGHDISPDGSRLVYITSRHQKAREFDLETSKLDGSDRRRLTTDAVSGGAPRWSPDGNYIAFVDEDISITKADGTFKRRIIVRGEFRPFFGHGPIWSPDGNNIAFVERIKAAILSTVAFDGSMRRKAFETPLSPLSKSPISEPSWSPDGQYLAFALYYEDEELAEQNGLYIVKLDGTGLRRLTEGSLRVDNVDWSPDGEEILTGNGLVVKVVDGETRRVLPLGLSTRAVWSPDGSRIAALTWGGQLIVANRDGTDRRNLTTGGP